ncbi:Fructose-1,6-bisphosphatase class 2 [Paenibacillus solanacearum]|uniref:Fructose-1,6-bisphosphatase n=1 Tax=Paenibacillus solanacearum TaxID=2048548 RepID=A0A916K2F9_9BACL|nr:class II fructose-bisphosphatase [Paenibacillus solanacearum]CAG7626433.1 Fructose-1,6-bisphosphatase class 2 [Paenibacillus solanacearum]
MKQLALEFLRVTQTAAIAALPWVGRGRKHEADEAATAAMRRVLRQIQMDGVVVIGEGEMDEAPMLYIGEKTGTGQGPQIDIAVDPLEGTNLVAGGQNNSTAVIAAAPRGALLHAPDMYMEKLAAGAGAGGVIDIGLPVADNVLRVAAALGKPLREMTVSVQSRERHQAAIDAIRETGAKVRLFDDGDVTCAIAAAMEESGIDLFYGIGGAPEGVISAVAVKCLGGDMQARLLPASEAEHERCLRMGLSDPCGRLTLQDMVASDECVFAATGITPGPLLSGIAHASGGRLLTHSLLTSGPSGVHFIRSMHAGSMAG